MQAILRADVTGRSSRCHEYRFASLPPCSSGGMRLILFLAALLVAGTAFAADTRGLRIKGVAKLAGTEEGTPDFHLLVVGIAKYAEWEGLATPVNDAKALRDLLWERYMFEATSTVELYDEAATYAGILDAMQPPPAQCPASRWRAPAIPNRPWPRLSSAGCRSIQTCARWADTPGLSPPCCSRPRTPPCRAHRLRRLSIHRRIPPSSMARPEAREKFRQPSPVWARAKHRCSSSAAEPPTRTPAPVSR